MCSGVPAEAGYCNGDGQFVDLNLNEGGTAAGASSCAVAPSPTGALRLAPWLVGAGFFVARRRRR
jgi:MYXO-CTERM domain-containing protein